MRLPPLSKSSAIYSVLCRHVQHQLAQCYVEIAHLQQRLHLPLQTPNQPSATSTDISVIKVAENTPSAESRPPPFTLLVQLQQVRQTHVYEQYV